MDTKNNSKSLAGKILSAHGGPKYRTEIRFQRDPYGRLKAKTFMCLDVQINFGLLPWMVGASTIFRNGFWDFSLEKFLSAFKVPK